jgi:hypothetical protein
LTSSISSSTGRPGGRMLVEEGGNALDAVAGIERQHRTDKSRTA